MKNALIEIKRQKIIAIIRGIPVTDIRNTVEALMKGGINLVEVTFDHTSEEGRENTIQCFDALTKAYGDQLFIGAGTVLTPEEVVISSTHGAKFIISPNTDVEVIKRTKALGLVSIPGALTPSEVLVAKEAGADIFKLFPAGDLGISYIKSIKAPLAHVMIAVVGGVNEDSIGEFVRAGAEAVGIGSNLVDGRVVARREYYKITEKAKILVSNLEKALACR